MSAFKKGWAERFKTNPSSEEVMVRTAYQQSTIAKADRKGTRKASTPMLPPILNVKHIGDLPQELTLREVATYLRFKNTEPVMGLIRLKQLYALMGTRSGVFQVQTPLRLV